MHEGKRYEADIISCLGVPPTWKGYAQCFVVQKDGLTLELTIDTYFDVVISIHRDGIECPIISITLAHCADIRHVDDQRGEYLEFVLSTTESPETDVDLAATWRVTLTAKPSISLKLF
jgi:hypothetical protein